MPSPRPSVVVLAGPNGAGKTTAAKVVLGDLAQVGEFVNADTIAQGLSAFSPESTAFEAGRIMLQRLHELADARLNFAFETTLASRSFAGWLHELVASGYAFHLIFFWVPSPEFAMARVANRVRLGGHDVDSDTIRRRYARGLQNVFDLYQPLATRWYMYNNTRGPAELLIARGHGKIADEVQDASLWDELTRQYDPSGRQTN